MDETLTFMSICDDTIEVPMFDEDTAADDLEDSDIVPRNRDHVLVHCTDCDEIHEYFLTQSAKQALRPDR